MVTGKLRLLVAAILLVAYRSSSAQEYSHQWAVHIPGGPEVAQGVADRHGFRNLGQIFGDYYHFQHQRVAKRSLDQNIPHHDKLINDRQVVWAKQQIVKKRVKRDYLESAQLVRHYRDYRASLNDPQWPNMWYLNRGHGLDMNVQLAWKQGITGKGITVTILDDGLEKDHPDIKRNYDPLASYDVNNHDEDPQPRYDLSDSNRHGTRCAGEVAADANNSICAVGIAYNAGVGGVRMLDGDVTDAVEARSLSLNPQHIDIYSASWGPDDDGKTVDGPGELATRAFLEGIQHGRRGLGSVFIWASGNGGRDHDNCNCDGYTNSIWTLSISSATENGLVPWYSEACSSTLATTYSSGSLGEKQVVTTDLHFGCTSTHTGTSASAPLAAGICALALEANPRLTWRDMQHVVVQTAKPANLKAPDWVTNGVGRNVSHSFGYGLMDAAAMVELARKWTTVAPQKSCEVQSPYLNQLIPAKSSVSLSLSVDCPEIRYLEHVQARISLTATRRGDIQIYLRSPMGTRSCLLDTRPHDTSPAGFHQWPFMTVHNWGEHPRGEWVLEIHNEGRYHASFTQWNLKVFGTTSEPGAAAPHDTENELKSPAENVADKTKASDNLRGKGQLILDNMSPMKTSSCARVSPSLACLECFPGYFLFGGGCVSDCPDGTMPSTALSHHNTSNVSASCVLCHYSCLTCSGPNDYDCTRCHGDQLLTDTSHRAPIYVGTCKPAVLLHAVNAAQVWYIVMTVSFVLLGAVVISLVIYILQYKNRERKTSGDTKSNVTYTALPINPSMAAAENDAVPNGNTPHTSIPFPYCDSSSDESVEH